MRTRGRDRKSSANSYSPRHIIPTAPTQIRLSLSRSQGKQNLPDHHRDADLPAEKVPGGGGRRPPGRAVPGPAEPAPVPDVRPPVPGGHGGGVVRADAGDGGAVREARPQGEADDQGRGAQRAAGGEEGGHAGGVLREFVNPLSPSFSLLPPCSGGSRGNTETLLAVTKEFETKEEGG